MKALISQSEPAATGLRVCDVAVEPFEVHEGLFWVDCPDYCKPDHFFWDGAAIQPMPQDPNAKFKVSIL